METQEKSEGVRIARLPRKYSTSEQAQRMLRRILYGIRRLFVRYLRFSIDKGQEEYISNEIRNGVRFRGTQMWVLIFAIFIASLGLNTNSTAVIIGAMLISPLMGPIMGVGLGVGISDFELVKRSATNWAAATVFAIITSTLYFTFTPLKEASSEILARTAPTIYDVLIALFGGLAGIVAMSTRQRGNVIPGVAIATALMPPLCTVGYGVAMLNTTIIAGAFQLFFINSVFIALATSLGARLLRFEPKEQLNAVKSKRVRSAVTMCIIAAVVPAVYLTYNLVVETYYEATVKSFVKSQFNNDRTQLIDYDMFTDEHDQKIIEVKLIGQHLPADSILLSQMRLAESGLAGSQLRVIQGSQDDRVDIKRVGNEMFGNIYKENQKQIEQQRQQIEQLTQSLKAQREMDEQSRQIAQEINVIFPNISKIAIAKVAENDIAKGSADSVSIVVVSASPVPTVAEHKLLEKWMSRRLSSPEVRVILDNDDHSVSLN